MPGYQWNCSVNLLVNKYHAKLPKKVTFVYKHDFIAFEHLSK